MDKINLSNEQVVESDQLLDVLENKERFGIKLIDSIFNGEMIKITPMGYVFSKPIENPFYPGYYIIPGFTRYSISKDGEIVNVRTGKISNWGCTKPVPEKRITGGYRYTSLVSDDTDAKVVVKRHRMLMLVFKPPLEANEKLIVNHINGIPGDDRLENLEWCTYSENTQHAYDTGLHSQKVCPIIAWNVHEGTLTVCRTIEEAAKLSGFEPLAVRRRTTGKRKHRYYADGWLFKENDGKPWPELEDRVYSSLGFPNVLAKHVKTGEILRFEHKVQAAEHLDIEPPTISHLCKINHIQPHKDYWFREINSLNGDVKFPVFDDFDMARYDAGIQFHTKVVELTKKTTGEKTIYLSTQDCATKLNTSLSTISRLCRGVANPLSETYLGRFIKRSITEIQVPLV